MPDAISLRRRSALPAWLRPDHPVFRMETRRRVRSRALGALQQGCLPAILGMTTVVVIVLPLLIALPALPSLSYAAVEDVTLLALMGMALGLVLAQLITGMAANVLIVAHTAPLISEEVELQSWNLLRSTTLSLREIVLAKYVAALTQLHGSLLGLLVLRVASAITLVIIAGFAVHQSFYWDVEGWLRMVKRGDWLLPLLAGVVALMWYVVQPLLNYLINAALGLAVSAQGRSRSQALAAALGVRLFGWVGGALLHVGAIWGLGFVLNEWASPYAATLEWFKNRPEPEPAQVTAVISLTVLTYVLVVAASQVGLIAAGLRLAERRARRLGG